MYKIYKHTLLIGEHTGWSYIGQTNSEDLNTRWQNGLGYKSCTVFFRAIQKYGWDNFTHEILEDNIKTLEEANEKEAYWIAYYHTWLDDPECQGYNATAGGNNCISESVKAKISTSLLGHSVSNTTREKFSQNIYYQPIYKYWLGKKRSTEVMEKILKAKKIKKVRCIETGEIYRSALYASKVVHGDVSRCVKGERKTAAGLHWEYVDENID